MHPDSHLVLSTTQMWVAVVGALVPLASYLVNRFLKDSSEVVRGAIHVAVAAVAAALFVALDTSVFGFNPATLQLVVTGVVSALAAHVGFYRPTGLNERIRNG